MAISPSIEQFERSENPGKITKRVGCEDRPIKAEMQLILDRCLEFSEDSLNKFEGRTQSMIRFWGLMKSNTELGRTTANLTVNREKPSKTERADPLSSLRKAFQHFPAQHRWKWWAEWINPRLDTICTALAIDKVSMELYWKSTQGVYQHIQSHSCCWMHERVTNLERNR